MHFGQSISITSHSSPQGVYISHQCRLVLCQRQRHHQKFDPQSSILQRLQCHAGIDQNRHIGSERSELAVAATLVPVKFVPEDHRHYYPNLLASPTLLQSQYDPLRVLLALE